MPRNPPSPSTVNAHKVKTLLQAISVLAEHASSLPGTFPSFTYSNSPNASQNSFSMTPGNSIPALVVWLFLVTSPSFLAEVANIDDGTYDPAILPIDTIAEVTNLTSEAVKSILKVSLSGVEEGVPEAFSQVAGAFQAFAQQHTQFWHPDDCPGGPNPLLALARTGSAVDPSVQAAPLPPQ